MSIIIFNARNHFTLCTKEVLKIQVVFMSPIFPYYVLTSNLKLIFGNQG